jgi:hypothetical protein
MFLQVSHSLVVRILAIGAGGPGSNPGGVTCGMGEEGQWKLGSCMVRQNVWWESNLFDHLQSKMSFQFIEISTNIC